MAPFYSGLDMLNSTPLTCPLAIIRDFTSDAYAVHSPQSVPFVVVVYTEKYEKHYDVMIFKHVSHYCPLWGESIGSPVDSHNKGPVTGNVHVLYDVSLNSRVVRWFETPSCSYDITVTIDMEFISREHHEGCICHCEGRPPVTGRFPTQNASNSISLY